MTKVLGVRVEQLFDIEAIMEKGGYTGEVRQAFEAVSRLPSRQQD